MHAATVPDSAASDIVDSAPAAIDSAAGRPDRTPLHVALVTETWPPEVNGVALTAAGHASGLRALGHRVSLVRPRQAVDRGVADDTLLVGGAAIPRYPGLQFGQPAWLRLRALWRATRPDAVYVATEGPLGWSAVRAARQLGIPVATGLHTRFDDYLHRYGAGWLAPVASAWLRHLHNQASTTLVPTRELQAFLYNRGFRHVTRLPRAVDAELFHPQRRCDAQRRQWTVDGHGPIVVHVGRIAAEKNLELAVRAFRALARRHHGARFVLIGDGPLRPSLAAAHPDFVFTGTLRGEALARAFASADLFLFPSTSETFGNVTLEAMASGVPTVAFACAAAREHLVDGVSGMTPPPGDDDAFIAAACTLADQPLLRQRIALAARNAAEALRPECAHRAFADLLAHLPQASR